MVDKKISELPAITNADLGITDQLVVVDSSATRTKKLAVSELDLRYFSLVNLSYTLDVNSIESQDNIHGGLKSLVTGQPLSTGVDINVTNGISKIMFSVNGGSDLIGTILVTGTSVDRITGVETPADSEVMTIGGLTTDASFIDPLGAAVHAFTDACMTTKWYKGSVVISTTSVTLTDVDVYQISFEQFNDSPIIVVDTMDITFTITNTAAEFAAHLYKVEAHDINLVDITAIADIELPSAESELATYRLRRNDLNETLDGTISGVFLSLYFFPTPQQYFNSIAAKIWAKIIPPIT